MRDDININKENDSVDAGGMVCIFGPGVHTVSVTEAIWFDNLSACRDYLDNQLNPHESEQKSVKFKNKVRELRNILKSIQRNKDNKDDNIEFVRACILSVINNACAAGHAGIPISITDILINITIKNSRLSQEKQKNIYAIPAAVWRQVFTEFYVQGYISITTVLIHDEQVLCIVPLKPYDWLF